MSNHNDTQSTDSNGAVLDFPDNKTVQTQASEWLAKLDAEQPSKRIWPLSNKWVNADNAHRIAFEEMVEFWDEMNILTQAVLPRELAATDMLNAELRAPSKPTSADHGTRPCKPLWVQRYWPSPGSDHPNPTTALNNNLYHRRR